MPVLNLDIINKIRKSDYFTGRPTQHSNYNKGLVLRAIKDNPYSNKRQIGSAASVSNTIVTPYVDALEEMGFISKEEVKGKYQPVVCYYITEDKESLAEVEEFLAKAPTEPPKPIRSDVVSRMPAILKTKSLTRMELSTAMGVNLSTIDGALRVMVKDGKAIQNGKRKGVTQYKLT
jgi:DNA-binding HxlR family transcriptional regulator